MQTRTVLSTDEPPEPQPPGSSRFLNFFARPGPDAPSIEPGEMTVWLDRRDCVAALPPNWHEFASATGQYSLEREVVLGRPVGRFIGDDTTRECFRVLFDRIRRRGQVTRIVARCDGARETRAMQLRLTPSAAGALECRWSFMTGAMAERIPSISRRVFHDGEHIRMCSWCRLVRMHSGWQRLELAAPALGLLDHDGMPPITHGICPDCSAELLAEGAAAGALSIAAAS